MKKINWLGLVAGITTLVLVAVSLYIPWWQMSIDNVTVGNSASPLISFQAASGAQVGASLSPISTNLNLLDMNFTVPLIWAYNLVGLLFMLTCGIVMLIYSVLPDKPYSIHLIGFAYKKPLLLIIYFAVPLIAFPLILQAALNVSVPLNGTTTLAMPMGFMGTDTSVSATITTGFLWTFWLAIAAAVLCLAARINHRKVAYKPEAKPAQTISVAPATAPATVPNTP
jgi:hypothetical protein